MLRRSDFKGTLSDDDYEEALLLGNYFTLMERAQARVNSPQGVRTAEKLSPSGMTKDEVAESQKIIKMLGYEPVNGRAQRRQGRTRTDALPNPFPKVGTKMQSCLGDTYEIVGYGKKPRGGEVPTQVFYKMSGSDYVITRSIANLLAGTLASGVPIVTWKDDPRGLKPAVPVPLNKRRTLTKRELMDDRHYDPDKLPMSESERRRRY